jgi:hypothetical protein
MVLAKLRQAQTASSRRLRVMESWNGHGGRRATSSGIESPRNLLECSCCYRSFFVVRVAVV